MALDSRNGLRQTNWDLWDQFGSTTVDSQVSPGHPWLLCTSSGLHRGADLVYPYFGMCLPFPMEHRAEQCKCQAGELFKEDHFCKTFTLNLWWKPCNPNQPSLSTQPKKPCHPVLKPCNLDQKHWEWNHRTLINTTKAEILNLNPKPEPWALNLLAFRLWNSNQGLQLKPASISEPSLSNSHTWS